MTKKSAKQDRRIEQRKTYLRTGKGATPVKPS
jgi:hypothetical protein